MKPLRAALVLFTLLLPAWPAVQAAAPPAGGAAATLAPRAGAVIVQFRAGASLLRQRALAAGSPATVLTAERAALLGARIGRPLQGGAAIGERMQVVRAEGVDASALAAAIAADPEVEFAVPDGRRRALVAPNDPLYAAAAPGVRPHGPDSGQWYLRPPDTVVRSAIDIEAAWQRTTGRADIVVAVLDTGVRFEHPDLGRAGQGGSLLPGRDFVSDPAVGNDGNGRDGDPSDPGDWVTAAEANRGTFDGCFESPSSWHGTSTASLVGAATNNAIGMAGTAPGVRVLPVRVLGKCFGTDSDIIAGMRWAAGLTVAGEPANPTPARVINMSLGSAGACNAAYQSAVDEITAAGVAVVAAAGNSTGGPVGTPANCRGVIGVLALRHVGTKVGFSDLGPEIAVSAPGGNCINIEFGEPCLYPIVSATNLGQQAPVADGWTDAFNITVGTSFSSPLVAGVAALMLSQQPALIPAQLREMLRATARPFPTSGADNGPDDPTPVAACRAPASGVEQLQCYCSTALCGAGMVDAGAAVAAVSGVLARIDVVDAVPTAGSSLTLSGAASLPGAGAAVAGYAWTLLDGGGIVGGFVGATNGATVVVQPGAAGVFSVRLTVTDSQGNSAVTDRQVSVAAAPADDGGRGGGAMAPGWLLALGLAAALLAAPHARRRRG